MHHPADYRRQRIAIVLGTSEIASAVAVHLQHARYGVVMSHDPHPPVIRRKMAFHDALFGDAVTVNGVRGERADDGVQLFKALRHSGRIQVTWLALPDLLTLGTIDVLVDARLQKHRVKPDLRRLARLAIGLGPGFSSSANCDVAIETRPGRSGLLVRDGWTDAADGVASPLGTAGAERFAYSSHSGRWYTAIEIGSRVFKGFVLGHLAGEAVRAPCDGMLRGIARDGSEVPAGVKLLEIDPRGRHAQWTGIDDRGRSIARAVLRAVAVDTATHSGVAVAMPSYPA
ncbi:MULTISPECIES: xanthine dehydrogenase [Rhodopseudomonas]|uniref:Xanthine dehydrogenase n=1 Tax=Rhodopseudomonas palustris TaxID=1076 RepID=A0A0D7F3T4_RHOPL|nr:MULTISPECIES: xanthine dehydrogenase [Rhodopseudomonas]KIZ47714.1 xanthine dehydrogenase [Rhodopseudomonas palustris]MDF3810984.1 xanthine dehydrogenase [Rhodopseudomonas sp. BAL398]WOK15885.1 xanthine dehydrogenase [Rhodopseudomonas sp. BAL398]